MTQGLAQLQEQADQRRRKDSSRRLRRRLQARAIPAPASGRGPGTSWRSVFMRTITAWGSLRFLRLVKSETLAEHLYDCLHTIVRL